MKESLNDEDAEFVITFCCDTVLQVESSGEIEKSRLVKQIESLNTMNLINERRKLHQALLDKKKEDEQAEKNREIFIVRFVKYHEQMNVCEIEHFHGGIGYAILPTNSPKILKQKQELLYAKVRGHQYGYIIQAL
jgi:hypothetical protein